MTHDDGLDLSVAPAPDRELAMSGRAHSADDQRAPAICIALHDLRGGGAERACLRLAQGFVNAKRTVDLVLVQSGGAYDTQIPKGVRVSVLNKPRVASAILDLARHIRRTRPRIVFSALTHMNIATILAAKLSGVSPKVVVSERNQIGKKSQTAQSLRKRGTFGIVPWFYRGADAVVAVSEGVADDLADFAGLSRDRIHVVHNPVFDSSLDEQAGQPAPHPWIRDGSVPVILAVGRLHPQKGYDTLLHAFARVRQKMPCRLIILGDGPERDALLKLAKELRLADAVSLPGFSENPFAFMSQADAFVLSSRWEGFPNVLVEAMACGAPVVSTDCPSGPREILSGGRYGDLVPVDNVEELADALTRTLQSRVDTVAARTRARTFSIAAATARYLDVLEAC